MPRIILDKSLNKSKSKHRNRYVKLDGYTFDSQAEANFYSELKIREKAREIESLIVHPVYELSIGTIHLTNYEPDFLYYDKKLNKDLVVDVKGHMQGSVKSLFEIKKELMKAIHNIDVQVIYIK